MFVVELGTESGEGEYKRWHSDGFYAGYTDKGPIIVPLVSLAFTFDTVEIAERMPAGDARLRNSRIKPVTFYEP